MRFPGQDADATYHLKGIFNFLFVIDLITLQHIIHTIHATAIQLEGRTVDIIKAYNEVNQVIADIQFQCESIGKTST